MSKLIYRSNQGITLVALVVTIVILLILAGISLTLVLGNQGIVTKAQEAKSRYATMGDELGAIDSQVDKALGDTFDTTKGVNKPILATGMTALKFNGTTPTTTQTTDTAWYDYTNKMWANSMTQDGSMWVWIPRYAYKIDATNKRFDVLFLVGTTNQYYDSATKTNKDLPAGYIVHPVFTDESSTNYKNGGWDKELTGIWVAKYEAGYPTGGNSAPVKASSVNYSQTTVWAYRTETGTGLDVALPARNWLDGVYGSTQTAIKYPTFQGNTYSMNYINHNDSYNISKVMNEDGNIYGFNKADSDTHLMKNSEWGACAYLCKSNYGLNTTDITINPINKNSGGSTTTKDAGNNLASVYAVTGGEKYQSNVSQSTTGNIYGIYDMSGGMWERTAAYIANGNGNLNYYAKAIAYDGTTLRTTSTKYTTVYLYNSSSDTDANNFALDTIIGDGIKETATAGTGSANWYGDYSNFPRDGGPVFIRGGNLWAGANAGAFAFYRDNGSSGYGLRFPLGCCCSVMIL